MGDVEKYRSRTPARRSTTASIVTQIARATGELEKNLSVAIQSAATSMNIMERRAEAEIMQSRRDRRGRG